VDFFDLFWRNHTPPQDLARAPIDAEGAELFLLRIKFRQKNSLFPNDGR
jgi:hypothetical protein